MKTALGSLPIVELEGSASAAGVVAVGSGTANSCVATCGCAGEGADV